MLENQRTENLVTALIIGRDLALDTLYYRLDGRDLIDTVILETVTRANYAPYFSGVDFSIGQADRSLPPPDDDCRPISIGALGRVLEIPLETVRRRVHGLIDARLLERLPKGLRTRRNVLTGPLAFRRAREGEAIGARAYLRLLEAGVYSRPVGLPASEATSPEFALNRLLIDYALDVIFDLRVALGGYLDGLLVLELTRLATAHLGDERGWALAANAQALAPDGVKAPVGVSRLARAAHADRETTRRRLEALVAAGICERARRRFIVPQTTIAQLVESYAQKNAAALERLLRALGRTGVLERWSREGAVGSRRPSL